jgi:hypothetical protein
LRGSIGESYESSHLLKKKGCLWELKIRLLN